MTSSHLLPTSQNYPCTLFLPFQSFKTRKTTTSPSFLSFPAVGSPLSILKPPISLLALLGSQVLSLILRGSLAFSLLGFVLDELLMSLAVGAASSSTNNMGLDDKKNVSGASTTEEEEKLSRQMSEASIDGTDQEEDDDEERKIELGPQCTLKEQIEKDNDDESLRRWKEQLLGSVDLNSVGETLEAEVKILSLSILSPGRPDMVLTIPGVNPKGVWFTLKEGSTYSLKFTFKVSNNIVSGLKYTNIVWKTGVKVDNTKEMLGVFSPQEEPYTHELPEETTPSGMFARGSYSAKTKFVDDDNKCHLEINYTFDIRKDWAS